MNELQFLPLRGQDARAYIGPIADLRLQVFHDWPYLYQGNRAYEEHYLETYFKAKHSFVMLVKDGGMFVGATTCILLDEEEESFKLPFIQAGYDPKTVCYFGESILLSQYRGRGIGKKFFIEREAFAKTLPSVKTLSFCSVIRSENHPLRPFSYVPLDEFWKAQGFHKAKDMVTEYDWQDVNESSSTKKKMQFWLKQLQGVI